jgi:hypothetical protein
MSSMLGEWREVESSPLTGKCFARSLLLAWEHLRRSLPRHSIPAAIKTEAPQSAFFRHGGIYRSDVVKTKTRGGSRLPPAGRSRTQVKERAGRITPFSSSAMSSGRLFLDRVARQHCPSPLHRRPQNITHPAIARAEHDISTLPGTRHFYFALTQPVVRVAPARPGTIIIPAQGSDSSRRSDSYAIRVLSDPGPNAGGPDVLQPGLRGRPNRPPHELGRGRQQRLRVVHGQLGRTHREPSLL